LPKVPQKQGLKPQTDIERMQGQIDSLLKHWDDLQVRVDDEADYFRERLEELTDAVKDFRDRIDQLEDDFYE
jgi:peptidoglycan hydrolase CwlO-like protein